MIKLKCLRDGLGYDLNCQKLLNREGNVMRHCIGGYYYKVENKMSRIFHLELPKSRATLEVVRGKDNDYKIGQLSGFGNSNITKEIHTLALAVVKEISKDFPDLLNYKTDNQYIQNFNFNRQTNNDIYIDRWIVTEKKQPSKKTFLLKA